MGLAEHVLMDGRLLHAHLTRVCRDGTAGPNGPPDVCGCHYREVRAHLGFLQPPCAPPRASQEASLLLRLGQCLREGLSWAFARRTLAYPTPWLGHVLEPLLRQT